MFYQPGPAWLGIDGNIKCYFCSANTRVKPAFIKQISHSWGQQISIHKRIQPLAFPATTYTISIKQ